jgi:hypothetical protein
MSLIYSKINRNPENSEKEIIRDELTAYNITTEIRDTGYEEVVSVYLASYRKSGEPEIPTKFKFVVKRDA